MADSFSLSGSLSTSRRWRIAVNCQLPVEVQRHRVVEGQMVGCGGDGPEGEGSGSGGAFGVAALWAAYLAQLDKNPVITKSISSAVLNAFGDIISQIFIEGDHPFDWRRLGQFSLIGLFLVGPTLHFWYLTLSRIVTVSGTSGAAIRLALDQLLFAPTFVVVFFSTLCCFELQPQKIGSMLRQEWWPAVVTNWKIWVPFQFLNFRLVPQNLQVLTANIIALVWNTYLSFASHREIEQPDLPERPGKSK
uniref:Protein Mpv17 n=1 Tax=Tetraselmis sp. GSL018 TaxID=582737 RepID=A0A061RKE2_9CHLO